ncbi:MAG TPA: hypothetical protein P5244_11135 [Syntrophales bacterium]|nr:hypothetical protein [Syntrophales bacterium]
MAYYVGLTDDPATRKQQHGNPSDWTITGPFATEKAARDWEKEQLAKGHKGGPGGEGWRYGYWYKITSQTIE